mmetsp:Transcript_1153/g.2891  ORF Transcript_1153/g.2891 Transcript_1153/m.2891 type:complete len:214 (-) Transcript_1153:711-1352(-)
MLGCYFLMLPSRGFDVDAGACSNFCRPSTIVLTLLGILNPWSFLVYRGGKGSILLRLSRNRRYVSQVFVLEKPGSFLKDRFVLVPRVVGRNVHVHRSLEDTDRRESVRLGIVVVVVVVAAVHLAEHFLVGMLRTENDHPVVVHTGIPPLRHHRLQRRQKEPDVVLVRHPFFVGIRKAAEPERVQIHDPRAGNGRDQVIEHSTRRRRSRSQHGS